MNASGFKIGAIVQARIGSVRLPGKVLLPFYGDETILDLVINGVKNVFSSDKIILATTLLKADDALESVAHKHQIQFFRGSESNVLLRFTDAADAYNLNGIVRVCADNPFLRSEFMKELILTTQQINEMDYISYQTEDNVPVMKTHFGFFCEYVKADALRKEGEFTVDPLYTEHVTNYIYSHPNKFKIKFLDIPKMLVGRKDLRLTIDTATDFTTMRNFYLHLTSRYGREFTLENIIAEIENLPDFLQSMKQEIIRNEK